MYRDHKCRNSSKVISRLLSLGRSLSVDPTRRFTPEEHPEIFAGIGVGCGKCDFQRTKKSNISETRQGRTKITIEDQYALSIGAKTNDLG